MKLLFAAVLLASPGAARAAAGSPLAVEIGRLADNGYRPREKASSKVAGGRLTVILYEKQGAGAGPETWLYVYKIDSRRAQPLHMTAGSAADLSLASIHRAGRIPDLAGDDSRIIAYRSKFPGLGEQSLTLLRYIKGRIEPVDKLPFGEFKDIAGDGQLVLLSRSRPLGKYFLIGCESKVKTAPQAFRTRVHAWRNGRLTPVSSEYPEFFKSDIATLREEITSIDARSANADFSEFLGLTLSLFFDYDEIGRGREGWQEFTRLFPVRRTDPGRIKQCKRKIELDLRRKLDIPAAW